MHQKGNRQVVIGAILSYSSIAFNIIAGILYTPWMIHTLGNDQYALYTLAISVINLFLLDFGIGSAVSKFLSNYYARGQAEEANRFMGIVYKVFTAIAVAIALCLLMVFPFIDRIYVKLTFGELQIFKRLFVMVGLFSVVAFPFTTFNGVLMANERFISVKACNLGQKVLNVAMIVCVLLAGMGVYTLVLVNAVSNAIFIVIKAICIRRQTCFKADFSCWDKGMAKSLFGYSAWVTVGNIAGRFIFNIMPTLIAAFIGSVEVTLFSLAMALEGYVFTFTDAINGMFLPKISRILVGEQPEKELPLLMSRVGRFHIGTIGLIYLGFVCVGQEFIGLWMGSGYEKVYICALLLIFPSLIDTPQQVARTALLAKDIVKQQAMIYVGMAVTNVILSVVLIPALGVTGAAISICAAYLVRTTAFNVLYRKFLPIDLGEYFKSAYGRWLVAAVVTTGAGLWIRALSVGGWIGLGVKAVLIGCVYTVAYGFVCVRKEERQKVFMFLRSRWK